MGFHERQIPDSPLIRLGEPEGLGLFYLSCLMQSGENIFMTSEQTSRRPKGNLVKELDAAIAILTRIRVLAVADTGVAAKAQKQVPSARPAKRLLSADAREAIANAQRKRWAKVRRQMKQAERAARSK
jgi:hypothetical protein